LDEQAEQLNLSLDKEKLSKQSSHSPRVVVEQVLQLVTISSHCKHAELCHILEPEHSSHIVPSLSSGHF
jgi:hypothetical protein